VVDKKSLNISPRQTKKKGFRSKVILGIYFHSLFVLMSFLSFIYCQVDSVRLAHDKKDGEVVKKEGMKEDRVSEAEESVVKTRKGRMMMSHKDSMKMVARDGTGTMSSCACAYFLLLIYYLSDE
jgi:hypothetical protein